MLEIISHRGHWCDPVEKNTMTSFKRALDNGFGIETDFRDNNSRLAISHDLPHSNHVKLCEEFLLLLQEYKEVKLAINIKSDGISDLIVNFINSSIKFDDYFVFDMSAPATKEYIVRNIPFYSRHSEFEVEPNFYSQATGIWLDSFEFQWYDNTVIKKHLAANKKVVIVSPELHGRNHSKVWQYMKENGIHAMQGVKICTDYPMLARSYFNEN